MPSGAAQEIISVIPDKLGHKTGLVNISEATLYQFLERLYSYGIFLFCHNFSIFCKVNNYSRIQSSNR